MRQFARLMTYRYYIMAMEQVISGWVTKLNNYQD